MTWFGRGSSRELPEFLRVPWSIRDMLLFLAAWFGLQIIVVVALSALSPVIPPLDHFLKAATSGEVGASFVLSVLDAAVGFGVIAWYLRRYQVGWEAVGWRRVSIGRAILYLVVILVLFLAAANVLLWVVSVLDPGFQANQPQENDFITAAGNHRTTALVALVLLPPILEETVFRGFMFPALAKRVGLVGGAIISSAIFGLAHGQPNLFVYTFPLGLLLCFMYVRLGSIVPGIFLHMLNNYLAFMALGTGK